MFSDSAMDNYTVSGHIVGMLDRDQRTAKCPRDSSWSAPGRCAVCSVLPGDHVYHRAPTCKTTPRQPLKRRSARSRRNNYLCNTLRRLKQALLAGIYLLSLVSVPCSLAAPTGYSQMEDWYQSTPKWINPCSSSSSVEQGSSTENPSTTTLSGEVLATQIVWQATAALNNADHFKDEYANYALKAKDFQELHDTWKELHYDWLPNKQQIPKNWGESVPEEHLDSLKLDDALVNTYHYLQMVAVGLEQVVRDQERNSEQYFQHFNQSERYLRLVLCEIRDAIYERGIQDQMERDVTRDHMPGDVRNEQDTTSRNLRDWVIFRDYMNALQYVIGVFSYLKNKF